MDFLIPPNHTPPPRTEWYLERLSEILNQWGTAQHYPSGTDEYQTEVHKLHIQKLWPTPSKLLFLGCGNGAEVAQAAYLGHDSWGVTLNPNNLNHARTALQLQNVFMFDALILPKDWTEQFDGVLSFQFMEHSIAPLVQLMEIKRVLKHNAITFHLTPGPGTSQESGYTLGSNLHHSLCYTATQAEGLMLKAGFTDIQIEVLGPIDSAGHLNIVGRKP